MPDKNARTHRQKRFLEASLNGLQRRILTTFLLHEIRGLRENWLAALVLVMIVVSAVLLRFNQPTGPVVAGEICYVLHWAEDDWVQALKKSADGLPADSDIQISVAPVEEFTDGSGLIRYPRGAHSIQIRPAEEDSAQYLIWYWYDGPDERVLWPYARWFWNVTNQHFGNNPVFTEMISPLRMDVVTPIGRIITPASARHSATEFAALGLLWLSLLFPALCLPILSIGQEREQRTIISIAITPAGWAGFAVAKSVLYAALSFILTVIVALILRPGFVLSYSYWIFVVCGIIGYLSVAFTITSLARTVATASLSLFAYGLANGLLIYIATLLGEWNFPAHGSLEFNLLTLLADVEGMIDPKPDLWAAKLWLTGLALMWTLLGMRTFRRAMQG